MILSDTHNRRSVMKNIDVNKFSKGYFMKRFKAQKAYLVFMLILTVFINSSLVYGGSDERVRDHKTPDTLEVTALFGSFGGGSGMTNQGIYTVVNEDLITGAASPLATGVYDKGADFTETTSNSGAVNRRTHTAHPLCQDSCSL
jgi:hypothetical protein